ncbi:MAG: threonylcarbamoyl-AMP synthase [Spirochaetes bacterium GWB1_48_6]|nr:MAG: threonylcarbamoyl-AMP synthase [Spirochaetes bacterium GWB1_48_6]
MKTNIFAPENAASAAPLIRKGGLVVFPTETVYGLGANALNPAACTKIFSAKGRPSDNPLIVHISGKEMLGSLVSEIPREAEMLMEAFWPGPLSLVLPKLPEVPDLVTSGLKTVGIRWPRDPIAQEFLKACGVPVAAPSANVSGFPSTTNFEMARFAMLGRVDGIIQGLDAEVGLESTIVGFVDGKPRIYRLGGLQAETLAEVLGLPVEILLEGLPSGDAKPLAPGMKYPHYKPSAEVILFRDPKELKDCFEGNPKIGVLCYTYLGTDFPPETEYQGVTSLEEYAHILYKALHELDQRGCTRILAQLPEETGLGRTIANRLKKAAGLE